MKRSAFVCAFLALAAGVAVAQQSDPYQGVSHPPADDTIVATPDVKTAKPPAGHPYVAAQATPVQTRQAQQGPAQAVALPTPTQPPSNYADRVDGTDAGIVQVAGQTTQMTAAQPALAQRQWNYRDDPDGGIVHPPALGPGEMASGTMIRVRLLNDLSSSFSKAGEPFRARVASDVLAGGQVVIPAGAEIDGRVTEVSRGHFGGSGSMRLQPERVTLPDGSSYQLHAMVSSTPSTPNRVQGEGEIIPDPGIKRAGIEYGGAIGAGAVTGAYLGGPVGALVGGLVGAGAVTTHLLVSHPQVHLDEGSYMTLMLTHRMHLVAENQTGS